MNDKAQNDLVQQYKQMRMYFFNICNEDMEKFEKKFLEHPLFEIVVKHFDKSFTQINQLAQKEITLYLNSKKE